MVRVISHIEIREGLFALESRGIGYTVVHSQMSSAKWLLEKWPRDKMRWGVKYTR